MREHYDFSMEGKKNSYIKYLKHPVNMCIDTDSVEYSLSNTDQFISKRLCS